MNQNLINVAIAQAPAVIGFLKEAFLEAHPTDPQPTDEEVIAAYHSAFASSIAKDEAYLAAHPEA
jgi:hypothetical protein